MGDLERDTAIEGGGGRYTAHLSRDWEIWGPNGGYVAAIALRAAGAAASFRRPASFSAHYLAVAEFDRVELEVETLRRTKRAASVRVRMTQAGHPILEGLAWLVDDLEGLEHHFATMPAVPAPAGLETIEQLVEKNVPPEQRKEPYAFWHNLECRPIEWVHWQDRVPGQPEWREWYRFRPRATFADPFVEAARSLLLIDTMVWPACCRAYPPSGAGYIAPSLDVNAHFHRLSPEAEWLLADAVAPVAGQGLVGGRVHVWDESGRLLASGGSQLLCRPAPPPA